jgi:hypothetical protein
MSTRRTHIEKAEVSQAGSGKEEIPGGLALRFPRIFREAAPLLLSKRQWGSCGVLCCFLGCAFTLLAFLLTIPGPSEAQTGPNNATSLGDKDRAKELIRLARAAIGGEHALGRIQTLTASGKYNRFVKYVSVQSPRKVEEKRRTLPGKMEFEFALPDKFRRRVTGETLRGYGYSFAQVVNNDQAWRDPPLRPISSNRDRRVIDVGDVARTEFIQATGAKQELSYFSVGWLMLPLPGYPVEMSYSGVYWDGLEEAHAIVAQGESGFRFIILLDLKTYAPMAVAISFFEDIQQTVMVESAGLFDRKFMQETYARARAERKARAKPAQRYEMLIRFSDRRPVEGVRLPFRATTSLNGETVEEMTVNEFEINRPINPKRFAGPPETKD